MAIFSAQATATLSVVVFGATIPNIYSADNNKNLRHQNRERNVFDHGASEQPQEPQKLVTSSDGFEITVSPLGEGEEVSGGSNNPDGNDTRINILVRLDRNAGSANRRNTAINALKTAAATATPGDAAANSGNNDSGGVYLDRSFVEDEDGNLSGPMRGIMGASIPASAFNGLVNSGLFEKVENDHPAEVLGWKDDDTTDGRRRRRRLTEETPWGIQFVQADQVPGNPANPIKVCVADTGFGLGHEDLPNCPRDDMTCKDEVDGTDATSALFGSGATYDDKHWSYDGHGHGTHCSGTVGAIGGNDLGVVGVFNDTANWSLQVGKALARSGSGYGSTVMDAVAGCVATGAKVISLSLGSTGSSTIEDDFYSDLYLNHDVLLVAAAGNGGNNAYSYPASYNAMVSVAALDSSDNLAGFSQVNNQVEIAGPGVSVLSTLPGNAYAAWSGTSMATPHVAAVAAKVWSHFPQCKNWHIRNALGKSAVHPDSNGDPTFCDETRGHGNAQAKNMYDLLNTLGCNAGGISRDGDNTVGGNMVGGCDQVYETLEPTISPAPSTSYKPSSLPSDPPTNYPTVTHPPSLSPSMSVKPSQSPSDLPSYAPSITLVPSDIPSNSPTYTPTSEERTKLSSPSTSSIQIQHGVMFDIKAKVDMTIYNLNMSLYTTAPTNVTIYTKAGSFWPDRNYFVPWTVAGVAYNVKGSGKFADTFILPRYSIAPITVAAGATQAFYLKIPESDTSNRVSIDNTGSNLHGVWFENEDMSVYEGVFKHSWGSSVGGGGDSEGQTFRFLGAFHYIPDGTRVPTAAPTISVAPSLSAAPSRITAVPSPAPSESTMPTGLVHSLITPSEGGSKSAYGYMFDLVAKGSYPVRVLNFEVRLRVAQCDFQIYTKMGISYYGYNQPELWTLISSGTVLKTGEDTSFLGFPPQTINQGENRAFFISFMDCSSSWPLAVSQGSNYGLGTFVEDDYLKLMEGIKFGSPLTQSNPFGIPNDPYVLCCSPGHGWSYSMARGSISYDVVGLTLSPTISKVPSSSPTKTLDELEARNTNYFGVVYGYMFDIEVANTIVLAGMDIMLKNNANSVSLSIYYKSESHVGYDKDASAWTLLYTRNGMAWGGSYHTAQPLPDFNVTSLSPGVYGFFIDTGEVTSNLYCDNKPEHLSGYQELYVESQDMVVNCGKSKGGWGTTYSGTVGFQGSFYYYISGTRSPTATPTSYPSIAPSDDCGDGDACTNDLWNSTSETCYHESIDCDDNDSCTNDSCDPLTGCSYTAIPNCCGDGICDSATETCMSCAIDCCTAESLSIPPESDGSTYGISAFVFDISAVNSDIAIRSLTLSSWAAGTHRALVLSETYSPTSSHWKNSADEVKWTEIGSGALTSSGTPHELVLDNPITILAGTKRGFALEAVGSTYRAKRHQGLEWQPFMNNTNAALSHSMAVPSLFTGSYNGCYDADELMISYFMLGQEPTLAPTNNPTKSPTLLQTNPPTEGPTSNPSTSPTLSPSKVPTKSPTDAPSKSPTDAPTPLPKNGFCSDNTGRCSETDLSDCGCSARRNLIKGKEEPKTSKATGSQGRYLAKKTSSPISPVTDPPTKSPMTPSPTNNPTSEPTSPPTLPPSMPPTKSPTGPVPCTCLSTAFPTSSPTNASTKEPTSPPTTEPTSLSTQCVCDGFTTKNNCNSCGGGGVCRWQNGADECIPR